jgi:hypothetical protein
MTEPRGSYGIITNDVVPAEIIQDAQTSAGQARYVEAVDDCIKIAEESSAKYLVVKFEELKAKFLETI